MRGKSFNKRHKNNDKELKITNTLSFYPFVHLKWYQNVSSKIINLQK